MSESAATDLTRVTKKLRKARKAATAEERERISSGLKLKWRDPDYRQRMVKAIKEGMANKKKRQNRALGQGDEGGEG